MSINLLQKQTCHLKNITYNHFAMRDEILIYNDSGTGDIRPLRDSLREYFSPQGIKIDTVTADDIIKNDRLNGRVLAFFMPGGRATPYLEKLKVRGNQKIAEYVQSGGVYFGICAGAYYASRNVFFETDIKDAAVVQQCGLNLIDADAVGTLHRELGIAPYSQDFRSMAAAKVLWRAIMSGILPVIMAGRILNRCRTAGYKYWQNTSLRGKRCLLSLCRNTGQGLPLFPGCI